MAYAADLKKKLAVLAWETRDAELLKFGETLNDPEPSPENSSTQASDLPEDGEGIVEAVTKLSARAGSSSDVEHLKPG
jgi:hypothetical protein